MKEFDFIQSIENYMFEDHPLIRRAAVQCWTNLCTSPYQVNNISDRIKQVKANISLRQSKLNVVDIIGIGIEVNK